MKSSFSRFIAVLLLVIPGFLATYGFLLIKDAVYDWISLRGAVLENEAIDVTGWDIAFKALGGAVLFLSGVSFLGGWIFYRDRKRNYVAPRFMKKKKRE